VLFQKLTRTKWEKNLEHCPVFVLPSKILVIFEPEVGDLFAIFFEAKGFSTVSTGCVTCVWAGVDSVWEQEKLEARKMLENRAESPASSARFVRRCLLVQHSVV